MDINKSNTLEIIPMSDRQVFIPLAASVVVAGFPSPAEDYLEAQLDINDIVISNKAATYYVRVRGDSMYNANLKNGDILVVDKSLEPISGSIVVAYINNEFTVKTLSICGNQVKLLPANPDYPEIILKDGESLEIWGVVTYIIHKAY